MDRGKIRSLAKKAAAEFLKHDSQYRMGYIEAEQPHPLTRRLSQTYQASMEEGVKLLFSVDDEMAARAADFLKTEGYARFADTIRATIQKGGRVVFSGCGSSGRLAMGLEKAWRRGVEKLSEQYPLSKGRLKKALNQVGNIMTGGDYAVIRAVESFEDSTALGEKQAEELKLGKKDLLVGVTATGETTSILGTAMAALKAGARVYMLICSDPTRIIEEMDRVRVVYQHENCRHIVLPCGPMALTGSTRMQSSSFEQFAAAVALEGAFCDLLGLPFQGYGYYGEKFKEMTESLLSKACVKAVAAASEKELAVYQKGGLITLFADEYLLDVLTDTTERAPTFMTPPFCSRGMADQPQSWAFVKNPTLPTKEAWKKCFLRTPNCIGWSKSAYEVLGLEESQIEKIPDISLSALEEFYIGNEFDNRRERAEPSFALWVDAEDPPESFYDHGRRYGNRSHLTFRDAGLSLPETAMDIYGHAAMKMMLNTLSTGVMAAMGRISGNWMVNLAMSNKKLVDRSARIVSDQCGVSYERALEEVYYAKLANEELGILKSPAQTAIQALGVKE